ncbi:glycoside hydrolase family 99-like domain-containing protein, partial [bacterium]|nr:glycoside hydrolase family 99-like domain-containing protein [bacterium]
GIEDDVLLQQSYSVADDLAHIRELISVFKDERYFKHNGRPVLLVYRSEELPDPKATARMWRREVQKAGFDDIYLLRVEGIFADIDPTEHGFDAAIEFAPDWRCLRRRVYLDEAGCWSDLATGGHVGTTNNRIFLYEDVVNAMLAKEQPDYKRYPGVFPAWDNSARRQEQGATIIHAATPATYQYFLEQVVERTRKNFVEDDQLIFINAWNEWGEGCHLEADLCHGAAFLESTYHVLNRSDMNKSVP